MIAYCIIPFIATCLISIIVAFLKLASVLSLFMEMQFSLLQICILSTDILTCYRLMQPYIIILII
jgi:hypothetical protein